jgi:hypothetical protein
MFDLPLPIHPTAYARGVPPHFPSGDTDPNHPFALTLSRRAPADLMSGRAAPLVLSRFATLAEAMQGAIDHAEGICPGCRAPASGDPRPRRAPCAGWGRQRPRCRLVPPGDEPGRSAERRDRGEPAARAGRPRDCMGRARSGGSAAPPRRSSGCASRRPALARLRRPGAAGRCVRPERQRRAGGIWSLSGGERSPGPAPIPSLSGDTR